MGGTDYSITGVTQFLSVPYALYALSSGGGRWEKSENHIYFIEGNVGIGESSPLGRFHVSVPGEWAGVIFTGTGLNDLEVDISGYIGSGATHYAVRIQNTGPTPNLIEASNDGGTTWTAPFPIAPDIDLGFGVVINFGSTSGYTWNDRWDWTVNESFADILIVKDDKVGIGTAEPTQTLDVDGLLRIRGGNPGEGKVLTSDEIGNTSWQPLKGISPLSCIDLDGNAYPAIVIGNMVWMAENLRVTRYSDGKSITHVEQNSKWAMLNNGAYCWLNNDQSANAKYGALYNWYAVNDPRGLCPEGWRVPTFAEWKALKTMLGGQSVAGGKLKAVSPLWNDPNVDATNSTGFSALPAGTRNENGIFNIDVGGYGYWWSATEDSTGDAWLYLLPNLHGSISWMEYDKRLGISVRCI